MNPLLTALRRRPLFALLVVTLALAPVAAFKIPAVQRALLSLIEAMRGGGLRGVGLYVLVYGLGGAFGVPKAPFHILAGFVYGPVYGALVASPAGTLAASSAFVLGRTALRGIVRRRLEGNPTWDALEELLRTDGLRAVWLARMTPAIPQNIFSFAAATTPIAYPRFALGTWLGLLPITCFHAYLGSVVESASAIVKGEQSATPAAKVGTVAIAVASAVGIYAMTRFAKRRLSEIVTAREARDAETPPATSARTG